ncbi:MAG TPA: K(+)-transporting ATPase subunit F [Thermoanaerobaculia bacterium]|nr:K(+)-transporting ATPase subunit F [Thermoanaerobaculia bacterium]
MNALYLIAGLAVLALAIYLFAALFHPERFS